MQNFSLEYNSLSFDDPHSRKILRRLLILACTKTEICTKDKKMLIEAVPQDKGCLILITLIPHQNRKIYRIKRQKKTLCFIFNDIEKLISASIALSKIPIHPKNSVYSMNEKYVVVMEDVVENNFYLSLVTEFSDKILVGKIHAARVKENGKLLADNNGIKTIGAYFT